MSFQLTTAEFDVNVESVQNFSMMSLVVCEISVCVKSTDVHVIIYQCISFS